jgi:hypothetical protein
LSSLHDLRLKNEKGARGKRDGHTNIGKVLVYENVKCLSVRKEESGIRSQESGVRMQVEAKFSYDLTVSLSYLLIGSLILLYAGG